MTEQSYAKHARYVPGYHFVLPLLLLLATGGALVQLYRTLSGGSGRLFAAVLVLLAGSCLMLFWYCRVFALRAQDRAIRAEENLRHFALTGKLLDPRLTMRQTIGLRFASDVELPALAQRAAEEGLSERAIKQQVKGWRADHHRL